MKAFNQQTVQEVHPGTAQQVPRTLVMVCLSPSPSNKRVIRTAAKMASPDGKPIALYVGMTGREAQEDSMLAENILFASENGFEIHTVQGNDISLAIAEYARRAGVTDLFLGYSPPPFFLQAKKPINEKLLSYLPTVDIHIVPDPASSPYPEAVRSGTNGIAWSLPDLLRVLAIMAAATLLSLWFYHSRFSNANIITIYILAVLIASVMTSSRIYGLIAAVLYVLLFNFLFIDPHFTLLVYDSAYLLTYLVTAVAALITGTVTIRMKNIARISAENAFQTRTLLDTVGKLERAADSEDVIRITCGQLVHLLDRAVVFCPPEPPSPVSGEGSGPSPSADSGVRIFPAGDKTISEETIAKDQEVIRWTMENRHHAGAYTSHFPDCSCRYLCLFSGENLFGSIGIAMEERPFTEFETTILLSIVHECTMALENERMGQVQREIEIRAENEQLRASLLRSLSHDLRTPLTSIYGNAFNLQSYDEEMPPEERRRIYAAMMEDAQWLNIQFENILSMTRLESGHGLYRTVENMEDVLEEALRHIASHPGHRIEVVAQDQMLFAEIDTRLLLQVLINLLNNAVKYTPEGSTVQVRMQLVETLPDAPASMAQGHWILMEVADNGPGIPDEDKPHIFELFYTGRHTVGDSYRSMGIGLNLCAQILRAHGGGIDVTDNLPSGALFRFWLPAVLLPEL
ncbi:MAG: DUF4118 domain-containing protein [Eubacteriales bacterium]|nr:DUF4118 domain-containing protein [Eubacteriales bacterium]